MDYKELMRQAVEIRKRAYTPYSGYQVGAALLGKSGRVYLGCNVENAAYSPGICAERTAFVKAVSEGEREFSAIAVIGGKADGPLESAPPCGICRQVMREFCDPDTFEIILGTGPEDYQVYTLSQLLPMSFGPDNLRNQETV